MHCESISDTPEASKWLKMLVQDRFLIHVGPQIFQDSGMMNKIYDHGLFVFIIANSLRRITMQKLCHCWKRIMILAEDDAPGTKILDKCTKILNKCTKILGYHPRILRNKPQILR